MAAERRRQFRVGGKAAVAEAGSCQSARSGVSAASVDYTIQEPMHFLRIRVVVSRSSARSGPIPSNKRWTRKVDSVPPTSRQHPPAALSTVLVALWSRFGRASVVYKLKWRCPQFPMIFFKYLKFKKRTPCTTPRQRQVRFDELLEGGKG
ncbi:hypothetical protein BASA81_002295 [Batrachochytrium salamandrivorans]|nr:hypothetical protein BASA81_002295 [Batrachochytrium salamandrivorans]